MLPSAAAMTNQPINPLLRPPIILLGMHRSGTSLIARLLDQLGLFQGCELQEDHESTYFLNANDQLMRRIGASWDNPAPVRAFLENPLAIDLTARCLAADVQSQHFKSYLGLKRQMAMHLAKLDKCWGWKDPRTVFTLSAWLKVFPQAKFLYIVRNGIDVAASLRVREVHELDRRIREYDGKVRQFNKHSMLERAGFKGSARCLTLAGGFSLWEEYVAEAERLLASLSNERMVVSYERFLADPAAHLPSIATFCGLSATPERIAAVVANVDTSRSAAFKADAELADFYATVRQSRWMTHYGYDQL